MFQVQTTQHVSVLLSSFVLYRNLVMIKLQITLYVQDHPFILFVILQLSWKSLSVPFFLVERGTHLLLLLDAHLDRVQLPLKHTDQQFIIKKNKC